MDCQACGFTHLYPLLSKKNLENFYSKEFYRKIKPEYINKTKKELDYWEITYRDRLEVFNKYIKRKHRRILDIGCSGGYFLKYFKERGWQTLGIELSLRAAKYTKAYGIDVINKSFEDTPFVELGKFDAINMSFVLEHLTNPHYICKKVYEILNPGGIFCVESPNDFNPLQKILKEKLKKPPYWVNLPEHINYFTPSTLENLLKKIGFKVVYKTGTFPMEFFVFMGHDYIGHNLMGRKCHKKRMGLEKLLDAGGLSDFKKAWYQFMLNYNIGRDIIIYVTK